MQSLFRRFIDYEKQYEELRREYILVRRNITNPDGKGEVDYEILGIDGTLPILEQDYQSLVRELLAAGVKIYDVEDFVWQEVIDAHRSEQHNSTN